MPILQVYVDDTTELRLKLIASRLGRDWSELAEAAVSEAALREIRQSDYDASMEQGQGATDV